MPLRIARMVQLDRDPFELPILKYVLTAMLQAVRFFWTATKGSRLRPWRSPYLRWRVETYTGKPAQSLRLRDFVDLLWAERAQMLRFFRWSGGLRGLAAGRNGPEEEGWR